MRYRPFEPTCAPIDHQGTATLIDHLNDWFESGGETGESAEALAILDQMAGVAGQEFTGELLTYLAEIGLDHLADTMPHGAAA